MADWSVKIWNEAQVADATVTQYAAGLRYIDVWHQLRYGAPLPLRSTPPKSVGADVIDDFISDHLAIARDGRLEMRMPPSVRRGLRDRLAIRVGAVSPKTTIWRLQVLNRAHYFLRLPFDASQARFQQSEIIAIYEAEKAAQGTPTIVPMSATNTVNALVAAVTDDREGIMDAALVQLVCRLHPAQVCDLRFSELSPGVLKADPRIDMVELRIREPASVAQSLESKIQFIGSDATAIKRWGGLREAELDGDDWFFARPGRNAGSEKLKPDQIARRIKLLAQRAGVTGTNATSRCTPTTLRKAFERERHESFPITKVARAASISTRRAIEIVRRARERL